jgi:spermidine synthase
MQPPRFNQLAAAAGAGAYSLLYLKVGYDAPWAAAAAPSQVFVEGLVHLLLLPLVMLLMQQLMARYVLRYVPPHTRTRFLREEPWTHLVWLAGMLLGLVVGMTPAVTFTTLAALGMLQAALLGRRTDIEGAGALRADYRLAALFTLSGFAALVYQVCWQRALFSEFGVNSESVTVIVSVFMFGLGVGALAGGWLQRRFARHLLLMFVCAEVGIGLFGIFSLRLIHALAPAADYSLADMVVRVYALLGVPTLFMGATLPVLVAYFQRHMHEIGRTVGLLYALNTLGSAIAAFATVQVMFVLMGLQASVIAAALANFATAALVVRAARRLPPAQEDAAQADTRDAAASRGLPGWAAFLALAAVGFLSLSLEILWYRLVGYMTASRPDVFGMLLAAYLTGIAAGAFRIQAGDEDAQSARRRISRALAFAALTAYLAVPLVSWCSALAGHAFATLTAYVTAGLIAYWCGTAFPVLIRLGVPDARSNSSTRVAWLYFGNIVGSALGPLVTGFVMLDRFELAPNMLFAAGLAVALALLLYPTGAGTARHRAAALGLAGLALLLYQPLYSGHLERMMYASWDSKPFKWVEQDRSAILTVEAAAHDIMYGHGIYDGNFNTDPVVNSNLIDRAYMVAALHREPVRILQIGLSTGSWAQVLSGYAPCRELVVVEIAAGYEKLLRHYPETATALSGPNVKVHLDDGRRWLRHHPAEKFDFIVMNSSFPWRNNSTHLFSREFLELARSHLNPGGVIYYNTQGWDDIFYTAAHVFKHVVRFSNFVAASDAPFVMSASEKRANLLRFAATSGNSVFDQDDAHRHKLVELVQGPLPDLRPALLQRKDLYLITDDNMATEYKVRR